MRSNASERRSVDDSLFNDVHGGQSKPVYDKDILSITVYDKPVYDEDILSMPVYDELVYDEDIFSIPVYDTPLYDEDIFYQLPGVMSKSPPHSVKFDEAVENEGVAIYDDEKLDSTVGYLVDYLQQLSGSALESQVEDPMVTTELIAVNTKGLRRLADKIKSTGRGLSDEDSSDSSPLTNKDFAAGFDDDLTDSAVAASSSRFAPTSKYFVDYFAKNPSGSPSISTPTTKHFVVGFDEKFVIRNSFLDKDKLGSKAAGIAWNFNSYGGFGIGKRVRPEGSKNRKISQVNHKKKRKKRRCMKNWAEWDGIMKDVVGEEEEEEEGVQLPLGNINSDSTGVDNDEEYDEAEGENRFLGFMFGNIHGVGDRQLFHDYAWEIDQVKLSGDCEFPDGSFVKIPTNLVFLFSPIVQYVESVDSLVDYVEMREFNNAFSAVREAFSISDIHLYWIAVKLEIDKKKVGCGDNLAAIMDGIRKIGWGFCSSDYIILSSVLLPLGMIYPQVGMSFYFADFGGIRRRKYSGELNLDVLDVKGKPFECMFCDLELVILKTLSCPIESDDIFNGAESRDSYSFFCRNAFLAQFGEGTMKTLIGQGREAADGSNVLLTMSSKLERDLENENGGAGVCSASLKKLYILAHDEWREDILPELLSYVKRYDEDKVDSRTSLFQEGEYDAVLEELYFWFYLFPS